MPAAGLVRLGMSSESPKPSWIIPAVAGLLLLVLGGLGVVIYVLSAPPATPPGGSGAAGPSSGDPAKAIDAVLRTADDAMREGRPENAQAMLEKAVAAYPNDQELYIALARSLVFQQKNSEAYQRYLQALRIGPALAALHFDAATVAASAKLFPEAIAQYELAERKAPTEAKYPLYLAMVQVRSGDDSKAMASLARVLKLNPNVAEAWGTMAELEVRENKLDLALQHAAKARELQPQNPRWRVVEARILKRDNKPQEAAERLMALDASDRHELPTLALLGECFGMLSRPSDAAREYTQAAAETPTNPELWYQAALWQQKAGQKAEAVASARRAMELGHAKAKELVGELGG